MRILFAAGESIGIPDLIARMNTPLTDAYDLVTSIEAYEALPDKYAYDILVVFWGPPVQHILNDQSKHNTRLKFVQALTAGIEDYLTAEDFRSSESIPLYNVRGAFSHVLGEFVALGMLYHSKHVEKWQAAKQAHRWEKGTVDLCSRKTMAIVGFGDIGAACGRICKAFGTKIIGLKRRPE